MGGELALPMIERLVLVPTFVQFSISTQPSDSVFVGLSHHRDLPALTNGAFDPWNQENVWIHHNFGPQAELSILFDLRDYGIEIAGPQRFIGFSNAAGNVNANVRLWFDSRMTELIRWSAIAKATSFED